VPGISYVESFSDHDDNNKKIATFGAEIFSEKRKKEKKNSSNNNNISNHNHNISNNNNKKKTFSTAADMLKYPMPVSVSND
jgi:hypothetical protein